MQRSAFFPAVLAALPIAALFATGLSSDVLSRTKQLRNNLEIRVVSKPIGFDQLNAGKTRFGRLTWRGGLVLSADHKKFGGYSGLAMTKGGKRLYAVSDQGTWLRAEPVYKEGKLTGLRNSRMGPLRRKNGKGLRRKKLSDAEDIVLWKKKGVTYALISFERQHRIGRFPIGKGGISKPVSYLKLPKGVFRTTRNKGLEALTILTDKKNRGTVLTFLERRHDKNGHHKGWLIRNNKSWPIRLTRKDGFDITGMTTLANGNVLVLERSFSLFGGIRMRIREIEAARIKKGAVLKGKRLIDAGMRYNIDNMEGIANHVNEAGENIITLISDNNFNRSGLQRTLLLQFKLD